MDEITLGSSSCSCPSTSFTALCRPLAPQDSHCLLWSSWPHLSFMLLADGWFPSVRWMCQVMRRQCGRSWGVELTSQWEQHREVIVDLSTPSSVLTCCPVSCQLFILVPVLMRNGEHLPVGLHVELAMLCVMYVVSDMSTFTMVQHSKPVHKSSRKPSTKCLVVVMRETLGLGQWFSTSGSWLPWGSNNPYPGVSY